MIEECKNMKYEKRSKNTSLTTLETRTLRADLIEVYRILWKRIKGRGFFWKGILYRR